MSEDMEPIRSRREWRQAQSEQGAGTGEYPSVPFVPAPEPVDRRGRRTLPAPQNDADAPAPRERSSQTRARDRAALRVFKELAEPAQDAPLPSRRAMRQAQLEAERAPVTSLTPVVPQANAPVTSLIPVVPLAKGPATGLTPVVRSGRVPAGPAPEPRTAGRAPESSVAPLPVLPEAHPAPLPVLPEAPEGRRFGRRAAGAPAAGPMPSATAGPTSATAAGSPATPVGAVAQAAARPPAATSRAAARSAANRAAATQAAATRPAVSPAPATEQAARPASHPAPAAQPADHPAPSAQPAGAGAPQAAAVPAQPAPTRGLVPGGAYHPVTVGPGSLIKPATPTPSAEELQALAEQRAQAERAAVLSQRAQAKERLAQESARSRRTATDPTAANNLAMVTPLEFMEVPGLSQPVLRPPTTTHVPIVTRSTPKQSRSRAKPAAPSSAREANAQRFDAALSAGQVRRPGPGHRPLTGGHSTTLKRAQAMASEQRRPATAPPAPARGEVTRTQMPPMPADYAHGLEPLDAVTAGLGRTQRNLLIQWGSIILGGAALLVGAVMIITGLAH